MEIKIEGERNNTQSPNYEAIKPEHYIPWMLEAFNTLKRN